MKISELPKKDRQKALEYQKNADKEDSNKDTDELLWAFSWQFTDEGFEYWSYLHHREKKEYNKSLIIIVIFAIIAILIISL